MNEELFLIILQINYLIKGVEIKDIYFIVMNYNLEYIGLGF